MTLTSCSLFSSRDGAYTGYYLPLTVHLRSDPSIAGAQLTYQDACGQAQSLPIAVPLQELLKRKTGRVFEKVLTGETGSLSGSDGYVDTVLGLAQVDLAIPRKANKTLSSHGHPGIGFRLQGCLMGRSSSVRRFRASVVERLMSRKLRVR